jgi:arylsulfatase A-like enzyme
MTDQQRADLTAREGFPLDVTPFLDELAREGQWFDRAYTSSPLCCPARTSMLTGRYPSAHRVTTNPAVDLAVFGDDLFGTARSLGYATALVGKNHSWMGPDDADAFIEFSHGGQVSGPRSGAEAEFDAWLDGLRHRTSHEPSPFPVELQDPVRIVGHALDWIATVPDDQPLLLWLSFPEPHNPYQVPEPYFSMFPPETLPPTVTDETALDDRPFAWRYLREIGEIGEADYTGTIPQARSNYLGMLRLIDDQLRLFYGGLRERHTQRPRISMVTADHGDFVGEYGLVRKGAEIPELLARIPMVIEGDGIVPNTTGDAHPAHVSITDVFPTLCEAMGVPIPAGNQGRSLLPMLTGESYPPEAFASAYVEQGMGGARYTESDVHDPMPGVFTDGPPGYPRFDELNAVTQSGRRRMVRSGHWKLLVDEEAPPCLFNLADDPLELRNLWDEPGLDAERAGLLVQLAHWQMRAEDPLPLASRGYPVIRLPHDYPAEGSES